MAFLTNWVQSWIYLPNDGAGRNLPTFLQWFVHTSSIPSTWDNSIWSQDLLDWYMNGFGQLLNAANTNPLVEAVTYFGEYQPGVPHYSSPLVPQYYHVGDALPATVGVVIRRRHNSFDPSIQHSFQVCGIDPVQVDGSNLTSTGLALWYNACLTMSANIVSQGVVFIPVTVSYAQSAVFAIDHFDPRQRLTTLRRRRHQHKPGWIVNPVPKPPPL